MEVANVQVAYKYGYNGDGVRVWKRDGLNQGRSIGMYAE
jgi:hypothetical protein